MHLLLADRLACPRCGPEFGLVLFSDALSDRRLLEGELGCPNCRERYPVRAGFADLRPPPREAISPPDGSLPEPDTTEAMRLGALLGVSKGPGEVVLLGRTAALGRELAGLVPGVEFVCVDGFVREWPEEAGVSRLTAGPALPFFSGVMRGVAVSGDGGWPLKEAARIAARGASLVVLGAPDGVEARLAALGLEVVLVEEASLLARRR